MSALRVTLVMAAAAIAVGVPACADAGERNTRGRVAVVATTAQTEDIARQVGGDRIEVSGLLEPGAEPHGYEPVPSDAAAVARADVAVASGAGLDAWLGDLLENAGSDAVRVEAARGIALAPTEERGFPGDPHVWHDPALAARMADNVAAGLGRADPRGRAAYERNAARYRRRLERMAARIRRSFGEVPRERRRLVTSHDAFGYFARAYEVEVVGSVLPAVAVEAEPSARALRRLVEQIRANRVRTIFTERSLEPRIERRIAEEAGASVSSSLYADTLGPPGSGAETLIEAELANARAMRASWR